MKPRGNPEGRPFGWYEKTARKRIREMFAATRNVTSALEVYSSLTEIASDEQKDTFETTLDYIASKAGTSAKTVGRILPTLVKIGILQIKGNYYNGIQGPSTYALLAVDVLPDGHHVLPDGLKNLSACPTSEKSKKQSKNNDDKTRQTLNEKATGPEQSSSSVFDESTKKRKRFANYCRSVGGTATEAGFLTWNNGPEIEADLPDSRQGCIQAMDALRKVEERAGRLSDRGLMVGSARTQYLRLKKHREQLPK